VRVAQVSQPCAVAIRGLKGWDGDLDVDDWFGRETGNGSRSDMLNAKRAVSQCLADAYRFRCKTSPASRDRMGR
jgi:hypothetical protein